MIPGSVFDCLQIHCYEPCFWFDRSRLLCYQDIVPYVVMVTGSQMMKLMSIYDVDETYFHALL